MTTPAASVTSRAAEVIIDAISLTVNGIRFFHCPTTEELSEALGSLSRASKSIGRVWDGAGVSRFSVGNRNVVEFTIDRATQTQHGYQGDATHDFCGSMSIFNYTLPSKPIFSEVKAHWECLPKQFYRKHVDFELFEVADLDPDRVSPLDVEIYVGRFPPKPVFAVVITFMDRGYEHKTFNLKEDEDIIATHGLHEDQFWFAVTTKRLVALKRDKHRQTSPAGDWTLSEIRGFHIIPRSATWWQSDYYRQRFAIELLNSIIHLRGFFNWFASVALRYERSDAESSERFFRFLRLAQSYSTHRPSDISCTRPPISGAETPSDELTSATHPPARASEPVKTASTLMTETTIWTGHPSHYHYLWLWLLGVLTIAVGVGLLVIALIFVLRARYKYSITNRRAVLTIGLIIKSSKEVRIDNIRHVNILKRGVSGLFGVGDVELPSAATDYAEVAFKYVRRPEQVRDIVRRIQDADADLARSGLARSES